MGEHSGSGKKTTAKMSASLLVLEMDPSGTILACNETLLHMTGYEHDELIGRHVSLLIPGFWEHREEGGGGDQRSDMLVFIGKDGRSMELDVMWGTLSSSSGEEGLALTAACPSPYSLAAPEGGLQAMRMLENNLLWLKVSADGIVRNINRKLLQLLGYERAEVIGQPLSLLTEQPLASLADDASGEAIRVEYRHACGDSVWLETSWNAADERCADWYMFGLDVTPRATEDLFRQRALNNLSLVMQETENAVAMLDDERRITYVNKAFKTLFGYDLHEVAGEEDTFLFPSKRPTLRAGGTKHVQTGKPFKAIRLCVNKDGKPLWASIAAYRVQDECTGKSSVVVIYTDITIAKIHEVFHAKVLDAMLHGASMTKVFAFICRQMEKLLPNVVVSLHAVDEGSFVPLAYPSLPEECVAALMQYPTSHSPSAKAVLKGKNILIDLRKDKSWEEGRDVFLRHGISMLWVFPLKGGDGALLGCLMLNYTKKQKPVSYHKEFVQKLRPLYAIGLEREKARYTVRQLSYYDTLTGLPNRDLFLAQGAQALARCAAVHQSAAVMTLNLNRFKVLNESLGHQMGNDLLCLIARRLSEHRRNEDCVCRLSGDEFALLLPNCSVENVTRLAKRLRAALCTPCQVGKFSVQPSTSMGISMFPDNGQDMETLLQRSGLAMHQAKRRVGTEHIGYFSSGYNKQALERFALENRLRKAVENSALELYYQPQVSLTDGSLHGVEALCRWNDPAMGSISPTQFIPLAEENGCIHKLSLWSVEEACRQLTTWRGNGLNVPCISVNLSASTFHSTVLLDEIVRTVRNYGLTSKDIMLEITESVLLDEDPICMQVVDAAHAQGFSFSLDDFGTGYSGLGYLLKLPVAEIKLDRSFVIDVCTSSTNRQLSQAVLQIGTNLNLTVVAEGVETEDQLDSLRQMGYSVIQGYYFSKPLAHDVFEAWFTKRYCTA